MFVRIVTSVAFALFPWATATAQEPADLQANLPSEALPAASLPTIIKRVDEVNILFSATNYRGAFIRDLNQADLHISDNGEPPAKITHFQRQTDLPLRMALVIDTSDSVTSRFRFEQGAAQAFLKRILRPKGDSALIIGFNRYPALVQPTTNDLAKLNQGIRSLTAGGETALFDAIALACDQLGAVAGNELVRRAIILITDGQDTTSHLNLDQAVEYALRAEAVIYVVNTQGFVWTEQDKRGMRAIHRLAETTGGQVLSGSTENDIAASFWKIDAELRSQYALGYRPPTILDGAQFHSVRIAGPKRARIRSRQGYYVR